MQYDVLVQWMERTHTKTLYKRGTKWYRNVEAPSLQEACAACLEHHKDYITPSVSMCWPSIGPLLRKPRKKGAKHGYLI